MIYFSLKNQSFYDSEIHTNEQMPDDILEITSEKHAQLLTALNSGCVILDGLVCTPERPSEYHEWNGSAWVISESAKAQQLETAKKNKVQTLNTAAQAFVNKESGADVLPNFEVDTWPLQSAEATAWAADKSASTSVLDGIAAARGIDKDKLKAAALRKTQIYTALAAHVAGQRQAKNDQISAAKTLEEVESIEIVFTKPSKG